MILRITGLSTQPQIVLLKIFFECNMRSLLVYGAPVWYTLLSDTCKRKLEGIQRSATRVIFPDMDYDERLSVLCMPLLQDFIFGLCSKHFFKISNNPQHPLFERVVRNNCKQSSRQTNTRSTYRPDRARTQKRSKSFFQFFMRFHKKMEIFIPNESYAFNSVKHFSNGKDTEC